MLPVWVVMNNIAISILGQLILVGFFSFSHFSGVESKQD